MKFIKKIYCIYKIRNLVNNKIYIGQTCRNPKIRFREHLSNKNEILGRACKKYNKENFVLEILEDNISIEDIDNKEKYYIKKYNSLVPNGYNLSHGGQKNKTISNEGKISLKNHNLGINNPRCNFYILMIDMDSNKILNKFGSAREAGRYLGNENKYRAIINCLSGKQKNALGYIWKYEED